MLRSNLTAAQAFQDEYVAEELDEKTGEWYRITRFAFNFPQRKTTGAIEAMAYYAGESVDGVLKMQPAAEIVPELAGDVESLLRRW